jgi:hypothetical protein
MRSVEEIQAQVAGLVLRRQRLRELGAGPSVLERNRLAIAQANHELSSALIALYLQTPAAA